MSFAAFASADQHSQQGPVTMSECSGRSLALQVEGCCCSDSFRIRAVRALKFEVHSVCTPPPPSPARSRLKLLKLVQPVASASLHWQPPHGQDSPKPVCRTQTSTFFRRRRVRYMPETSSGHTTLVLMLWNKEELHQAEWRVEAENADSEQMCTKWKPTDNNHFASK